MDEDHDERRFVCKLCDKRFPSGKSLGGHMRSHVIAAANSAESDYKFELMKKHSTLIINGNHNGNQSSNFYGLRDNPIKSCRASSSSTLPFTNDKICKLCGKGFQSLKALCGHMAFHSEKDRSLKDHDYSWTSENLDHEDTEEIEQQDPVCVTRSKSKMCKKVVIKPSSTNTCSNNSNSKYESSSVSEINEFEQEEVAMCLMMLSKDSTNWAGVHSVLESSDNNSVVFKTKLSSTDMKNSRQEWILDKNDTKSFPIENSNSGYCRNGIKKLESDISFDGILQNGMKAFNFRNLSYVQKREIRRNLFREFGYDNSLKKRIQDDDCIDDPNGNGSYKRNKYECLNCNKTFSSFQGLGGHKPCHKKNNAFNSGVKSADRAFARDQKNKGHKCPICYRMFKSGQALGGHKRSHFINGSEDRIDHTTVMEHAVATYTDMIDLNLPAPEED
ncbi:hypothetical protein R6Q57_019924 [Mikania cordata]